MENQKDIQLIFVDHTDNFPHKNTIVVFQKNVAVSFEETAIAWQVLESTERILRHEINFSQDLYISLSDAYGNVFPMYRAEPGQRWNVVRAQNGEVLVPDGRASDPGEIEIRNTLPIGAVDVEVYRSGKLLAIKTGVSPQQKAVFQFKPTIWVGMLNNNETSEGDLMNSAVLSGINTEISLSGITKAQLVISGGGEGTTAIPFKFTLKPMP